MSVVSGGRALAAAVVLCHGVLAGSAGAAASAAARVVGSPASLVDPFIGTSGDGNVFPGAAAPFGMVQWSPDTSAGGLSRPGGYAYGDGIIAGFSLTHFSGAGCVALANLPIMPTIRRFNSPPAANGSPYSDRFVHADEHAAPGAYDVRLTSGIGVHLAATPRTGFGAFTFPHGSTGTLIINTGGGAGGRLNTDGALNSSVHIVGQREVTGWTSAGHFCNLGNRFTLFFDLMVDTPFTRFATWRGSSLHAGTSRSSGARAGAALTFRAGATIRVKVGLSYVSVANARANLEAESPGWNEAAVRTASGARWSAMLGRIRVSGGTTTNQRIFYTALYHAFLHPNVFSDDNGQYLGFDGRTHIDHRHMHYANYSGWDIYRSQIQLLAWLLPHEASDMMQSLVDDARSLGWLPKWPVANTETGEMNGDSADPILAGAYAFGARSFDAHAALRFMINGATHSGIGRGGYIERPELAPYLHRGYIPGYNPAPLHPYGAAATTLEYNIDDYSIAQMAQALGDARTHGTFLTRSRSWRRLFNPATGLIEPRLDDGSFPNSFSATSMDGYVEGNALQYTWMVPHDLAALVHRIGGTAQAVKRLDPLFRRLNGGPTDPYDWAGNEPGFSLPWVYDFAGAPWRTQAVVRRIENDRYTGTVGGLPGNDDLGALSSWYVWAAIGLYPEIPGIGEWALTSPLFPHIAVQREVGRSLHIESTPNRPDAVYVQSVRLDGAPYGRARLPVSTLHSGSVLVFSLGSSPNHRWGT